MIKKNIIILFLVVAIIVLSTLLITRENRMRVSQINMDSSIASDLNSLETSVDNNLSFELAKGPEILDSDPQGTVGFVGVLQGIDTGCFADADCFAVVDGKKVIVQSAKVSNKDAVGFIDGVDSFVALFDKIGMFVEVKAIMIDEGQYTLYGSSDYFLRLM